ncbi:MAG: isopeptide-forming domain-containing fimbrial protein [Coriobacteriia bacterium]|nr:isopeptide-forming domain-containing fimbrial protein [Coriobacteriia bacterium]
MLKSKKFKLIFAFLFLITCIVILFAFSNMQNVDAVNHNLDDTWKLREWERKYTAPSGETYDVATNLIKKYYSKELKCNGAAIKNNRIVLPNDKNISNKPFICIEKRSDYLSKVGKTNAGFADSDYLLSISPDEMHKYAPNNTFSTTPFTISSASSTNPDAGIGYIKFDNAGRILDQDVDLIFKINSITCQARTTEHKGDKYAASVDDAHKNNVGFVFGTIKTKTISKRIEDAGGDITKVPQIAGSISLTADNGIWSDALIQTEVDYSIGITYHTDTFTPGPAFPYPVYSVYTDLDVQKANTPDGTTYTSDAYNESVSPVSNMFPYAYRFAEDPSESDRRYIVMKNGIVPGALKTFVCNDHATGKSGGFPASWYNAGVELTSNPSSSGYYQAKWRGMKCETGISLSPCPTYACSKNVVNDRKEFQDQYEFNIVTDAFGNYGQDAFFTFDTYSFVDYLPEGLTLKQEQLKDTNYVKVERLDDQGKWQDITNLCKSKKGEYITMTDVVKDDKVYHRVEFKFDGPNDYDTEEGKANSFLKNKANYTGKQLRLVIKPTLSSYAGGNYAPYSGTDKSEEVYGKQHWQFENIGAVICEDYEFQTLPCKVWTPLYGKDHKFYQVNDKGEPTETEVPDSVKVALPDNVMNEYKVGETVLHGDLKKTVVQDPKTLLYWVFVKWKEESIVQTKDTSHFIGYWKMIANPVESKLYDETKAGNDNTVTDGRPVKLGNDIAYQLVSSNIAEDLLPAKIVFTDTPSIGLTFNPETVKIAKNYNGVTQDITEKCYFENHLINNMGDGKNTIIWHFDGDYKIESTAKVIITYTCTVNEEALKDTPHDDVNNCTIQINNGKSFEYELINPVINKNYNESVQTLNVIKDNTPVKVGDYISYKIDWATNVAITEAPRNFSLRLQDVLSKGLEPDLSSFVSIGEMDINQFNITATKNEDGSTVLNIKTVGDKPVPSEQQGSFTYRAKVTEDAISDGIPSEVNNHYVLYLDDIPRVDLDPLYNPVIDKKYNTEDTTDDVIKDNSITKVGDYIAYKIAWATNSTDATGKDFDVVMQDVLSKGLEPDMDSFVFEGDESNNFLIDKSFDKDTGNTTLSVKSKNKIAFDKSGYITYRARVTKDAIADKNPGEVNNHYTLLLNDDPTVEIDPLINPVIDKQYNTDDKEATIHDDSPVHVGDIISYKISWINHFNSDASIKLTDTLSKGLEYVDGSSSETIEGQPTYNSSTRTLVWDLGTRPSKDNGVVTYRAKVTEDAVKKLPYDVSNKYVLSVGDNYNKEFVPLFNPVDPEPIKKYDKNTLVYVNDNRKCYVDDEIAYSLTWCNDTNADADVILTDTLSKGLDFVQDSASVYPDSVDKLYDGTTRVVWKLTKQEKGAFGTVTYRAKVNDEVDYLIGVDNAYKIKIGDKAEVDVNGLHNPVEKIEITTKTNDFTTLVVIALAVIAGSSVFIFKRCRKKFYK